MPRLRRPQPTPVLAGLPARQRNADRASRVSARLITAAQRGPAMVTAVEAELAGLGATQLKTVITQLWMQLARKDNHDA